MAYSQAKGLWKLSELKQKFKMKIQDGIKSNNKLIRRIQHCNSSGCHPLMIFSKPGKTLKSGLQHT